MAAKEVSSQSAEFGSPHYRRIQYQTETMMSEIWLAQRQDGSQVVAKFAIVDEVKLAAKMCMSSDKNDLPSIQRFLQQQADMVRQFLENNRAAVRARVAANQQAIQNEAEQWRALQSPGHPGIIQLYAVNEGEKGTPSAFYGQSTLPGNPNYLLAEYLRGGSLRTLISKEKGLSVERTTEMLKIIGEILAYIHDRRFVHLDIKPSNIVFRHSPAAKASLRDAEPILIDFGIAGKSGEPGGESRSEHWSERSRIQRKDAKGRPIIHPGMDIYSLGLMVRYMLTGQYPPPISEVKDPAQVYPPLKVDSLKFDAKLPKAVRQQIVDEFNTFGELCLSEQREKRPTTAQIARLTTYVQATLARPAHVGRRQGALWVTVGTVVALALLAAIFFIPGLRFQPITAQPSPVPTTRSVAASELLPSPIVTATVKAIVTTTVVATVTATSSPTSVTVAVAETVTSTPTASPTPTSTARSTPTSTVTPTPAPTDTSTPTAAPPQPTSTPKAVLSPTQTPLPTAVATEAPTATSLPTRAPTPTRRPATPTPQFNYATVTSLRNENGSMCGSTWQFKITVAWTVDERFVLPPGYGYDVVVWTPSKPGETAFTTPGIMNASAATSVELDVQSLMAQSRNPQLDQAIGVMLVKLKTPTSNYERVRFMGPDNCTFRFVAGGSQSVSSSQEGSRP